MLSHLVDEREVEAVLDPLLLAPLILVGQLALSPGTISWGLDAPQISAATMHPWVWDGARSLWQSGHFREAVTAAVKKVNAETQNKVGRRDVSEANLFKSGFSQDAP